ncbi:MULTISPECIES: GAF and ANTAR domain-containing protein [Rhodococcus]|uniref:GAF and ANTAR domain-containing protein n=1 Tax=Rhodococcus qingshengii TaxID=334542 RepID=A0AAW6LQX5_RHOSG|nr:MULTISPECIES: GAF and ANTAR domain-containing protein [Rhodococcus]ARE38042.1 hypothetical protein A0W34_31645 [Rhodococcus sp. BH4]MBQ9056067.1 GAF and ANTAR domain-containing protein [Rhodococcus sp. (in: high G+C Gram-positive bacteria)]MDE8649548.1 GAF and ANTAR domain-containing protein [Rhodococcus qingshengii]OMQ29492.1 hypothetical protein BK799_25870 [Rhodococcus sp. D-1]QXC46399.1 GAF and ANTAR domain-containing protein [Rhodococcus qingshengii]
MLNDIPRSPPHRHGPAARTADVVLDLLGQTAVDGAAVSVFSGTAGDLVYATDDIAAQVDELQFILGEGPTVECFRRLRPEVHHHDASDHGADEWPTFAADAYALDVRNVHAFPLVIDSVPLGVLTVYIKNPRCLTPEEERICVRCARSLVSYVFTDLTRTPYLAAGPYGFSRADVHIASGILAARHTMSIDHALRRLQSDARAQHRRVTVLAREVIAHHTETNTT